LVLVILPLIYVEVPKGTPYYIVAEKAQLLVDYTIRALAKPKALDL
jgi:hypothetical protein